MIKRGFIWLLTAAWTTFTLFLMLSPGNETTLAGQLSFAAGQTDLTDAIGHLLIFGILTALWYLALGQYLVSALSLAAGIGLVIGIGTELAQVAIPDRGATLVDLSINVVAVGGVFWLIRHHNL